MAAVRPSACRRRSGCPARKSESPAGPSSVLDFDSADADAAGAIRAGLAKRGTAIGPYDVLIAGQALCHGATLVTANIAKFKRVAELKVQNWEA